MTRQLIILVFSFAIVGCSGTSKETKESKELIESLIGTMWESTDCKEDYDRYAYTKHSFTFDKSELVFNYQYYTTDCVELLDERIERRSFSLGEELITSSGIVATKILINKIVVQPDWDFDVQDLLYTNNDLLYFGEYVNEEGCEWGNQRVDIQGPYRTIFYCDQQAVKLDFENYYTKKI